MRGICSRLRNAQDLATTLDFSKCTVPADIDTLKTYMRRSPRFTVKGVDTLYHLDAKISIPVDYVDANVFYFPPHKADVLVVPVPSKSSLQVLSAPTLLVHKVIATQDRPITELVLRLTKQLVDATDAQYLIHKCLQSWQLIQPIHARRFKGDAQRILSAFTAVSRSVQVCNDRDFAAWNALVSASGLSSAFRITNSSG